jgi:hypothetical protein
MIFSYHYYSHSVGPRWVKRTQEAGHRPYQIILAAKLIAAVPRLTSH